MHKRKGSVISALDLFCGVGGLTFGLVNAGVEVIAGVDIDPRCKYAYETNNDAHFICRSLTEIGSGELGEMFPSSGYRLIAGCAPCQPFSSYTHRYQNKDEDQWNLLSHFQRIVIGVDPDFVIMENVANLRRQLIYQRFVESLRKNDFYVWEDLVDCNLYGVPQSRKRLVLLASKHGPVELDKPESTQELTVRQVIGDMPKIEFGQKDPLDAMHRCADLTELNLARLRASSPGGTWRDWPAELRAECHKKSTGKSYPAVYGRMEWDAIAPTITTQSFNYGSGRFGHPDQDRAISLREAAMLQGFPRDYRFCESDKEISLVAMGRLIGNAVPVMLAENIGISLIRHQKGLQVS